jgi:hypothetical protein
MIGASRDPIDVPKKAVPHHDDAAVAAAQMLALPISDRA